MRQGRTKRDGGRKKTRAPRDGIAMEENQNNKNTQPEWENGMGGNGKTQQKSERDKKESEVVGDVVIEGVTYRGRRGKGAA